MTTIEKIRQEIERRSHGEQGFNSEDAEYGYRSCARDLLSFLDTLSEEPDNDDLNEEIKKFIEKYGYERGGDRLLIAIVARHFAEWQASQMPMPEDTVLFNKGVAEGRRLEREDMLKEAVEGEICGRVYDHINVRFADGVCKHLEPKNISHIPADVSKYNIGDKVRIVVLK